ncbi:MAG: YggS family pyridoxal phosphate-dependent enzyme [Ferruginibacter sp.]
MVNVDKYKEINKVLQGQGTTLVAVSKLKPASDITAMYELGQRDFGENYVQELVEKQVLLPADILWHFIGHLQSNKVKYIAPFIHLIQSVDSEKLLKEIDKQAAKNKRKISVLLQVHIAEEHTKFGFDEAELMTLDVVMFPNVNITGLMGMATFTDDKEKVKREFEQLRTFSNNFKNTKKIELTTLSMGMSDDYELAISCGSSMIRIGSLLFGERN